MDFKLLIDGSKILSAGYGDYVATGSQTIVTIDPSKWEGGVKKNIKWTGTKISNKTTAELLTDAKAEKKKELLPEFKARMIKESIATIESDWASKESEIDAASTKTEVEGIKS